MQIINGGNHPHRIDGKEAPTKVVVEVPEASNVQFLLYPKFGPISLETDFLEGEGTGQVGELGKGGFRTWSRSVHYRQIETSGAAKIVMPIRKEGSEATEAVLMIWPGSLERNESVVVEIPLT